MFALYMMCFAINVVLFHRLLYVNLERFIEVYKNDIEKEETITKFKEGVNLVANAPINIMFMIITLFSSLSFVITIFLIRSEIRFYFKYKEYKKCS